MLNLYLDSSNLNPEKYSELEVSEEIFPGHGGLVRIEVSFGEMFTYILLDEQRVELLVGALLDYLTRAH